MTQATVSSDPNKAPNELMYNRDLDLFYGLVAGPSVPTQITIIEPFGTIRGKEFISGSSSETTEANLIIPVMKKIDG